MTIHLGDVPAGTTLYIPFATYGSSGQSLTMSGLAVTDIEIYKNGSVTQRASDNGYALLDTDGIDFDGITGIHGFSVDLSDNSDSGFYSVGGFYWVVVSSITVNSQTVNFIPATFRICPAESSAGVPKVDVSHWLGTAAATPTVAGVPEVDITHILGTATSAATAGTLDTNALRVGNSTNAVTRLARYWGLVAVHGTADSGTTTTMTDAVFSGTSDNSYVGGLLCITAGTNSGMWRRVISFSDASNTVTVDTAFPSAIDNTSDYVLVPDSKYVDANVASFGGTAGTFSGGRPEVNTTHAAGTAWNSGAIGANTLASDTITAAKIAADAIGASELAADAVTEIQSGLSTLNAAGVRSAVGLASANLDTQIGTLATAANLATVAGYLDTEIADIKAKTDNLPSDPADASVVAGLIAAVDAKVDTVDTVVDAIKAKTDSLTFTVAGQVDSNITYVNDTEVTGAGTEGNPWGP